MKYGQVCCRCEFTDRIRRGPIVSLDTAKEIVNLENLNNNNWNFFIIEIPDSINNIKNEIKT